MSPPIFLLPSGFAAVLAIWLIRWCLSVMTRLADLPGPPPPSYIIGSVTELSTAPMGTIMNIWNKKYGQTYKMRGGLMEPLLILGDPRGAGYVLQGKNYARPDAHRRILEVFFGGRSLFSAEGNEHRSMRKYLNPAFTLQSVQEVSHIVFELADKLKQRWEDILDGHESLVFDILPAIHMLSFDAISMTMFMHTLSESSPEIPALLQEMSNSPSPRANFVFVFLQALTEHFPFLLNLPSPLKSYATFLRAEFGKFAQAIEAGKDASGMHAKVIDVLTQAKKSGEPVDQDEVIAQTIAVLFAGSETTANLITECLYELSRHPSVQQKLGDEIATFKSKSGNPPGFEDLMSSTSFPYLDAVVRETLRTKGPLQEISRMAIHDDMIPLQFPIHGTNQKEVHVKAEQVIQIPIRDGVNMDPAIWGPDVADFKPERWVEPGGLPPSVELIHAQGRTLTFGDGPKACLGRTFAIAEIKIVVASLVSHFAFEDPGLPVDFHRLGGNTVKPLIRGREAEGVQLPLRVKPL